MYDYLLAVGKTPEITKTVLTNPFSAGNEITHLAVGSVSTGAGASINAGTDVTNVTNPNIDWFTLDVINDTPVFAISQTAGNTTSTITWDMLKDYIIEYIQINYSMDGTNTTILQTSLDGVNWTNHNTTTSTGETRLTLSSLRFRYIRVNTTITAPGSIRIRYVKIYADAKQLIY